MGTPADPDGIEHAFKHPKVVFSHVYLAAGPEAGRRHEDPDLIHSTQRGDTVQLHPHPRPVGVSSTPPQRRQVGLQFAH